MKIGKTYTSNVIVNDEIVKALESNLEIEARKIFDAPVVTTTTVTTSTTTTTTSSSQTTMSTTLQPTTTIKVSTTTLKPTTTTEASTSTSLSPPTPVESEKKDNTYLLFIALLAVAGGAYLMYRYLSSEDSEVEPTQEKRRSLKDFKASDSKISESSDSTLSKAHHRATSKSTDKERERKSLRDT
jgi:hypothetical protein